LLSMVAKHMDRKLSISADKLLKKFNKGRYE